jgi:hypothetical protein
LRAISCTNEFHCVAQSIQKIFIGLEPSIGVKWTAGVDAIRTAGVDVKRTSRMAVPPPPQRSLLGHSGLAHAFENRLKRGEICGVVAHPRPRGSGA